MATTRIMPLHVGKGRTESQAISDIIDYAANPEKADYGRLITGVGCDSRVADAEFLFFVKYFSLKKASEFPFFSKGFSLPSAGIMHPCA